MNSNTSDQEYFKQETVSVWSSAPSSPSNPSSDVSSPPADQDYNVYHVPRGFDVVLVPLKVEEQTFSDSTSTESSLDLTSSSTTKPMDIPKSKSPSSTDAKASATATTNTSSNNTTATTTRLSAYRKRKADKNYIPRPKNCFMAYREHIKEKFLLENPGMNNKIVSVLAANMWNNEPEEVKELWRERAKQLKLEHKLKYPDYKFKPQKKKQNLKTPGGTKTSAKATSIRNNNKKSNSDAKIIFADGYCSEMLGDSDDGKVLYHSIGLEGDEQQEDIYLTHLQKKALFGHYRASSVDSVSSWTSDSTASTPLLSPFVASPASLSPPTFQFGSQFGRSSSALRYEAGNIAHNEVPHNNLLLSHDLASQTMFNEVEQLNDLYSNQLDINASLPVDDGFVLDSYESPMLKTTAGTPPFFSSQPSSTDYDLMAMGHYTASPIEEQEGFFHDYDNIESAYHNNVYDSSFELSSQEGDQPTLADHYAFVLDAPRRNSQQLLSDFQHGLKQQEMLLQGL